MTKQEWIEKIESGSDIMFDVSGKHFVIFTWMENGIAIGKQNSTVPMEEFSDAKSLVDGFLVDGVPLGDLVDGITITDYS